MTGTSTDTRLQVFSMPDVGEGLTEAEVLGWRVAVGDTVTVNQVLVEIETQRVSPTRSRIMEETTGDNGAARQASAAPAATIQILNGPNAGKELMLSKALTTLGRPGVQVAVITRRQQGYYITHVEGSSFPVVNGKALGLDATALTNHDIIELSGTKMEFFFR